VGSHGPTNSKALAAFATDSVPAFLISTFPGSPQEQVTFRIICHPPRPAPHRRRTPNLAPMPTNRHHHRPSRTTTTTAPEPPELSFVIALALQARGLTPAQVALQIYPLPRHGPDRQRHKRKQLRITLTALAATPPRPPRRPLEPKVALGIDLALGLPLGFCALVGTLDALLLARRDEAFFERVRRPSTPLELSAGYAVCVPRPGKASVGFVDGTHLLASGAAQAAVDC
jgi:hypothetical protein